MPHCIIEHSISLDAQQLLPLVFSSVKNSQLFAADGSDIKVRAMAYQHYWVGQNNVEQNYLGHSNVGQNQADFVHVVLKILSGRSTAQKQQLSQLVLTALQQLQCQGCSYTVEVVDMDRDSYAKLLC